MKWSTKKFMEQSSTFESFSKFFKWAASKEKNPQKRQKYLTMSVFSIEMKDICLELAKISKGVA